MAEQNVSGVVAEAGTPQESGAESAAVPSSAAATAVAEIAAPPAHHQWFVIHTYSGFENKVKQSIEQRVAALALGEVVSQVMIPTETVVELKKGKRREASQKFFPGYVLVQMEMSDETWHLVRNTPKVTGFVGGSSKAPVPLTQEEVDSILHHTAESKEKPKPRYVYERGEQVKITDGPFKEFTGLVEDINLERSTLRVLVTIFGRPTPVELEFVQVQKL